MKKIRLARDLMSRPVRQLTSDTPVRDAAAFLLRHGISGAPVIDEHARWIGVFTQNDLARAAVDPEKATVQDFMTPGLFTVFQDATMEEVIRTMSSFRIHRVFVIDEFGGRLLGVITTMDLLAELAGKDVHPRAKTRRA